MTETPAESVEGRRSRIWSWWDSRLLAPLLMLFIGLAGAVLLTDGATESGDLSAYDPSVTAGFVAARSDVGTAFAQVFTFLGSTAALVPMTLAVLAWLGWKRRWLAAGAVAAGMSMSLTLTVLLKNVIGRARPPGVDVLGAINTGFAFPSGHTLNGTVFFGLVTGLALSRCHTAWTRLVVVAGGVMVALGIGLSRVYLGYHWLTDVMAGWSLAAAVLAAVMFSWVLVDRRRGPALG